MNDVNEVLQKLRVNYQSSQLDIQDCSTLPFEQFDKWLKEAIACQCDEPNAFILSTVVGKRPRSRVLLLKGLYKNSFVFYTNYKSAKSEEIKKNDRVAMTFLWLPLQRQIRIEGVAKKIPAKMSDEYFQKRPRGSQIGAVASPQSQKVKSRDDLEEMFLRTEKKYQNEKMIPRPKGWGGYMVVPDYIEFWQGRDNRMHDRVCYELKKKNWERARLAP